MEIRVQYSRERARPAGAARPVRPATDRPVDPGNQPDDHRQGDGRQHQPPSNADLGTHVDKTA